LVRITVKWRVRTAGPRGATHHMSEAKAPSAVERLPASVYLVGTLTQFAQGLYTPFLSAYVYDMGANLAEMGVFRSVGNISPTILQPAWGAMSDRVGHTKAFVAFGTMTGLFLVYLFLWAATPLDMIVLYTIQSILLSVQIPTWLSLVGCLIHESKRGSELGRLGMATNLALLIATLVSGFIMVSPSLLPFVRGFLGDLGPVLFPIAEAPRDAYYLPFYLTAIVGVVAGVLSLRIRENRPKGNGKRLFPPVLKLLTRPGDFRKFCFTATFFSFSMSMAWPFFIIVQIDWLNNTLLEIAIASAISTAMTVAWTIPLGRLSDRVGRRPLIFIGRFLLFFVPLLYLLAVDTLMIYISNAIAGIATAASVNANTAYIYDVAPADERGSHVAVYNTFTGVVFLFGSLISGLIGQALVDVFSFPYHNAVFTMLLVSTIMRFVASFAYLNLHEPRVYQSDIWTELRAFVHRRRHDSDTF
jgi:MFS family permease